MKKLLLIFVTIFAFSPLFPMENEYKIAMESALNALYSAQSTTDYQRVAAAFERIGRVEKDEWLPSYYACLSYLWMSSQSEPSVVDNILDQAQGQLERAKIIVPNEAEVVILQGYIYMMRLVVDPANRGAELSPKSIQEFMKALSIDKQNPRALLLLGQMKLGTAQFFNEDISEPCSLIAQATAFLKEEKPDDPLSPAWGMQMAEQFRKNCEK